MSKKTLVYFAAFVGGIVGGYIPVRWGAGFLSISSLLLSALGGIIGIIIAVKYL